MTTAACIRNLMQALTQTQDALALLYGTMSRAPARLQASDAQHLGIINAGGVPIALNRRPGAKFA